jgi:hydroxymethylpyrimidine kinase/phosphomethylpyrimidine kinase
VAEVFRRRKFKRLVVDPVMVATSGATLLQPDAAAALTTKLLPLAALVTPNLAEAEVLWPGRIRSRAELREAARALAGRFGVPVLVKGGHLPGMVQAGDVQEFGAQPVRNARPHGAGCTLSAAIAAHLALGCDLPAAIRRAKRLVTRAIRNSISLGKYHALKL